MATTLSTVLASASYRLGEMNVPDDATTITKRIRFANMAQDDMMSKENWWFLETMNAQATVADQEIYTLPSNYRDMLEVRQDRRLLRNIAQSQINSVYDYPPKGLDYYPSDYAYYVFGDLELHVLPIPSTTPSSISISSLTRSGSTVTATTATDHGRQNNDYVIISGASDSAYNGTVHILSVPSTTTFTYSISGTPSTPATGTISMQHANLTYRYIKMPSRFTAQIDVLEIPDRYCEAIASYIAGRVAHIDTMRGDAGDFFEEYDNIISNMRKEQTRRMFANKDIQPYANYDVWR